MLMLMYLKSSSFKEGGQIPKKYSCQGENVSPPLSWGDMPEGTESLMLLVFDKDIPASFLPLMTIDHWVVYNIPPEVTEFKEGLPEGEKLENGASQGINRKGDFSYTGPCPPFGTHEYHFELYALNKKLEIEPKKAIKDKLLDLAKENVIQKVELKANYRHQ